MARGEGIKKVSDLFQKYTDRLVAPQKTVCKVFQEVVSDLFAVDIDSTQCSYTVSSRVLTLSLPGPLKSEILLRKKEVIAHLKGRLGERNAPKEIL